MWVVWGIIGLFIGMVVFTYFIVLPLKTLLFEIPFTLKGRRDGFIVSDSPLVRKQLFVLACRLILLVLSLWLIYTYSSTTFLFGIYLGCSLSLFFGGSLKSLSRKNNIIEYFQMYSGHIDSESEYIQTHFASVENNKR